LVAQALLPVRVLQSAHRQECACATSNLPTPVKPLSVTPENKKGGEAIIPVVGSEMAPWGRSRARGNNWRSNFNSRSRTVSRDVPVRLMILLPLNWWSETLQRCDAFRTGISWRTNFYLRPARCAFRFSCSSCLSSSRFSAFNAFTNSSACFSAASLAIP
jgi:hypothetical protein